MLKSVLLALPLTLTAMAAAASDPSRRDPACVHVATVQYLDCEVAVLYTCPGIKGYAAPLVREEAYNEQGFDHYEVDSANGGLIVSGDAANSFVIQSDPRTLVETTQAQVLKTGRGSFTAKGWFTYLGIKKPAKQKIKVTTSGEAMTLSGISIVPMNVDVELELPEPMGPTTSQSKAYLVPSLGLYLSGEEVAGTFFKSDNTPHRPLAISVPGQPGFDTIKPGTCGGTMGLLEGPNMPASVESFARLESFARFESFEGVPS